METICAVIVQRGGHVLSPKEATATSTNIAMQGEVSPRIRDSRKFALMLPLAR